MCARRLISVCLAVLVSLSGATVLAREDTTHQLTVDELLRLDSQAALLAARKNIFGVTQPVLSGPGKDAHPTESNQVIAIYGIGKILTAEVLLDSEPHVFKNSRPRPVWGPSLLYRLERIVPPCVHLKKTGKPQVICLRKGP
jgi:hypothetical protein